MNKGTYLFFNAADILTLKGIMRASGELAADN